MRTNTLSFALVLLISTATLAQPPWHAKLQQAMAAESRGETDTERDANRLPLETLSKRYSKPALSKYRHFQNSAFRYSENIS